jgi:uncharacterized membrane protein YidH (DUF202 family)
MRFAAVLAVLALAPCDDAPKTAQARHVPPGVSQKHVVVVLLVAGSIIVALLIAWRFRRYQRHIDDELEREYGDPPVMHDRAAPH